MSRESGADAPVDPSLTWSRLHPASPLIAVWQLFIIVPFVLLGQMGSQRGADSLEIGVVLAIFAVVTSIALGLLYAMWSVARYAIADDAIYLSRGILFRQRRKARLDRLQAVDVVQPFVPRLLGFAALKVEVAGGKDSGVKLEFLRREHATELRAKVLSLAAGARSRAVVATLPPPTGAPVEVATEPLVGEFAPPVGAALRVEVPAIAIPLPDHAERPATKVYEVEGGRLIGSLILSWPTLIVVALSVAISVGWNTWGHVFVDSLAESQGGGAPGLGVGFFGLGAYFWTRINRGWGFTASVGEDGIGLKHGLLDTRRQTVPPGRVQAIALRQTILWRRKDWWQVTINVAGYQDEQDVVSTLLPVGTRQEALYALWLVMPELGDPDPTGTISAAMSGKGTAQGFTASPRRSQWLDVFQWRHRGVKATDRALLIRDGLFVRDLIVVPHERTQSLALAQGPVQSALRLATLHVHSTKGVVQPRARHLAFADATQLLEAQALRARDARKRDIPAQWLSDAIAAAPEAHAHQ